jgi:hypothetical protein
MATLTNDDFSAIKKMVKQNATYRDEFKQWPLDKPTWKAAFQAAEDWFVNGFLTTPASSFKAAIEAETGAATNAQVKALGWVWLGWRFRTNP